MEALIHAHVVLNPAAGRGAAARALDPIAREFHHQGWSVEVERTERPGHGAELAARAAQAGAQRIVAVGGDGTVHDVANGLLRHGLGGRGGDVALGVVPIGSGNDFAKLVGVYRHSPVRGVRLRAGGRARAERHAWTLGLRLVFRAGVARVRALSPTAPRGAGARVRGDGEHDDGGGVQWHDRRRQLSVRPRRAAGGRPPGRVSRAARLAAAVPHGGAARDARDARHDAGGRPVSDTPGHYPLTRRPAAAARRRRAAPAGHTRVRGPRGAGEAEGDGGAMRRAIRGGACVVALLSICPAVHLSAQVPDTTPPPLVTTGALVVPTDTTHRIRPMGAFLRSLLVPGWGQAATGRRVTGALFATWEGVAAMMTLKAQSEMHYLKETGSSLVVSKRQQVQDWTVLWVFNHLFSGAEAFVSAHLQDFPKDLKIRAFPGGVGISLPVPRP